MMSVKRPLSVLLLASISAHGFAANVISLKGAEAKDALAKYEAALRQNPDDFEALKSAGIILHQLSRTEPDKQRVETAEQYLKKAQKLHPEDQEVVGWLGSVITMKALFETDPGKQTFFVKSGTRLLDKAVQKDPDNLVVRLTRAYNSMELPVFLKRTSFAVVDFKHYLALCESRECPAEQLADARDKLAEAEKILAENR